VKTLCHILLLVFSSSYTLAADDHPKMIATSPPAWKTGVIPSNQKTVSLSFDQQMNPAFTDWIGRSSVLPSIDLESTRTSPDRKVFEVRVTLEPAKVYVFALNEKGIPGVGFQNDKGISTQTYFLVFQTVGTPKPEDAPPVLVRAMPASGMRDIDPTKINSITLMFDHQMNVKKHGLQLIENGTAVDISKLQFSYSPDGRTFSLPYTFKANANYRLVLNSDRNIGFASAKRIPLWPLEISFATSIPR